MKNKIIICLMILLSLNVFLWPEQEEETLNDVEAILPTPFTITFQGEVSYPGIYTFYEEIVLNEAISYAGGLRENADISLVNLNEVIIKSKVVNVKSALINDDGTLFKIYNLNEISKEQIINLVGSIKGLTLNRAINIILYRQQNGIFQNVSDLLKVKDIGPATYEELSKYFTV